MSKEQCCGNCGRWELADDPHIKCGTCNFVVPVSIEDCGLLWMLPHEGAGCPCWKPKEESNAKD